MVCSAQSLALAVTKPRKVQDPRGALHPGSWTLFAKALVPAVPVISVSRPLDYEQIPNGLIYLTVMAKDAGSPPLYSTVPVTIEVFVSIQGH